MLRLLTLDLSCVGKIKISIYEIEKGATMQNFHFPQGSIIWIDMDPSLGVEQKGRRPALVISTEKVYKYAGLCEVLPITSSNSTYVLKMPLNVSLPDGLKTKGTILVGHGRSIDLSQRNPEYIEIVDKSILDDVLNKKHLLYFDN